VPLAGHGLRPTPLRQRASRPQLKRDPLGGGTMLSILEYQVLNACADDYEPFYYPFAAANYGGQVF